MQPPAADPLNVLNVKRTGEKVDRLAFHPVLPWIAYTRRDNLVCIWNFESDQVGTAKFW